MAENKDHEYPQKIFEIGRVFSKSHSSETGIKESIHLITASSPANFTQIKQILEYVSKMLNISCEIKRGFKHGLIEGRTASIIINGKESGYLGEVHPETLRSFNIKMPLAVLEISLEEIFDILKDK